MTAQLSQHLEVMDHEISGIEFQLEQQGYRVDGNNGIKNVVGLPNRKSVDYFYIKRTRCLFVEFSDIARGQEDLLGLDLSKHENKLHRNKIKKLLNNDTKDEMVAKFKDTTAIFAKLPQFYQDLEAPFLNPRAKTFYIVHAPINQELPDADKVEIGFFLRNLSARVSKQLEDEICDRVKLVLLDQFAQTSV